MVCISNIKVPDNIFLLPGWWLRCLAQRIKLHTKEIVMEGEAAGMDIPQICVGAYYTPQ